MYITAPCGVIYVFVSLAGGGAGWSHDLQSAKSIPAGVRCHCRASRQLRLQAWLLFKWGQQPGTNTNKGNANAMVPTGQCTVGDEGVIDGLSSESISKARASCYS